MGQKKNIATSHSFFFVFLVSFSVSTTAIRFRTEKTSLALYLSHLPRFHAPGRKNIAPKQIWVRRRVYFPFRVLRPYHYYSTEERRSSQDFFKEGVFLRRGLRNWVHFERPFFRHLPEEKRARTSQKPHNTREANQTKTTQKQNQKQSQQGFELVISRFRLANHAGRLPSSVYWCALLGLCVFLELTQIAKTVQ